MKHHNARLKYGRLAFVTPLDVANASGGQPASSDESGEGSDGGEEVTPGVDFPKDTRIADMTLEQQLAYWKHNSRKHESEKKALLAAKTAGEDDPAPKTPSNESGGTLDEGTEPPADDATDDSEGAADDADDAPDPIDEARREGENLGAEKFLKKAVAASIRAELKGVFSDEAIAGFAAVADPHAFLNSDGDLDEKKIADTFKPFAKAPAPAKRDAAAWAASHHSDSTGSAGSVKEQQDRIANELRNRNNKKGR